ncbi:MAG TPA: magnesium transporter CorA family protein [Rhizomicrobium sp.]|jgi:magnesium transporter|nr:magnesium transporter CorA family protein [Rhizomicrobium sp.]
MLHTYPKDKEIAAPDVIWVDLMNPTAEEIDAVEKQFNLDVPTLEKLQEIETSSRLRSDDDGIYVSMPVAPLANRDEMPSAIGFLLTSKILVTVRFSELRVFDGCKAQFEKQHPNTSAGAFTGLLEEMVDVGADVLEFVEDELNQISRRIFRRYGTERQHNIARSNRALREVLVSVGNCGERISDIRDSMLGLQRIIPFVMDKCRETFTEQQRARLKTAHQDLQSLTEFEIHVSNKVQFLLDAVLGFISTEQNDIFKVLTIVSVVGIPPTFIASWYGMNFHFIPEYAWVHGYPFVICLTALSLILPAAWFKWRGWW